MKPLFEDAQAAIVPFPHAAIPAILTHADADATLAWFEADAPWKLRVASFYEQYEFSLVETVVPPNLVGLVDADFVNALRGFLSRSVGASDDLELVDICAHKLVSGQTIRVHNDFIDNEETHRILVQLNSGWTIENGGILMLFSSDKPEDVLSMVLPTHGSGFAFEISERSFHAVSTIKAGERYTLVYTFRTARA